MLLQSHDPYATPTSLTAVQSGDAAFVQSAAGAAVGVPVGESHGAAGARRDRGRYRVEGRQAGEGDADGGGGEACEGAVRGEREGSADEGGAGLYVRAGFVGIGGSFDDEETTRRELLVGAAVSAMCAPAQERAAGQPLTLWYRKPASKWESEALPVGNGSLGAMVFGGWSTSGCN